MSSIDVNCIVPSLPPPTPPAELTGPLRTIDLHASQNPGLVLSSLRPALVLARGFDSGNSTSFALDEAAWAGSARVSSE